LIWRCEECQLSSILAAASGTQWARRGVNVRVTLLAAVILGIAIHAGMPGCAWQPAVRKVCLVRWAGSLERFHAARLTAVNRRAAERVHLVMC
jgi:hypothetical protein